MGHRDKAVLAALDAAPESKLGAHTLVDFLREYGVTPVGDLRNAYRAFLKQVRPFFSLLTPPRVAPAH